MNSTKEKEEKIVAVYYTVKNSASFSGPQKIYKSLKDKGENISLGDIKKWFKNRKIMDYIKEYIVNLSEIDSSVIKQIIFGMRMFV